MLLEHPPGLAFVFGQCEQKELGGDELVALLLGFLVGQVEQIGQFTGKVHLTAVALDLGESLDIGLQGLP